MVSYYVSCIGTNLEKIVEVLREVNDWEKLAGLLDLGQGVINGIKTECLRESGDLAICFRRKIVRAYCDETSKKLAEVARDIAHTLERDMASKRQADRLKRIFFGELCSNWCIIASLPVHSRGRRYCFFPSSHGLGTMLKQVV